MEVLNKGAPTLLTNVCANFKEVIQHSVDEDQIENCFDEETTCFPNVCTSIFCYKRIYLLRWNRIESEGADFWKEEAEFHIITEEDIHAFVSRYATSPH